MISEIELDGSKHKGTSKEILIAELKRIHLQNRIESKRLNKYGELKKYSAQNGGGYTLEAELGIKPNGYADPVNSKPLTLLTPEPDGGCYVKHSVEAFVRKYGYENTKSS